jgi:hypothetical protein
MEASIEHYGVLLAIGGAVLLLAFLVGMYSARYSVAERYAWGLQFNKMFHTIVALAGGYVVLSEPHTVWSAIVGCFMVWIGACGYKLSLRHLAQNPSLRSCVRRHIRKILTHY